MGPSMFHPGPTKMHNQINDWCKTNTTFQNVQVGSYQEFINNIYTSRSAVSVLVCLFKILK